MEETTIKQEYSEKAVLKEIKQETEGKYCFCTINLNEKIFIF